MKTLALLVLALSVAMITNAQVCFTPDPVNGYALGSFRGDIEAAKMDDDNQIDLVVTNFNDASVSVLKRNGTLPNGHPQFTEVAYPVGNKPFFLYVNDIDGDGDNDIAVSNYQDGTISVLLNDGSLGMTRTDYTVAQGQSPRGITGGYFNADGFIDLAVANYEEKNIRILYGIGNGMFSTINQTVIPTGNYNPADIIAGNFNGTGGTDLVVTASQSIYGGYMFVQGDGMGQFTIASEALFSGVEPLGGISPTLDTADFNNDGLTDIVFNFPEFQNQKIIVMKGSLTPNTFPISYQTIPLNTPSALSSYNIACADYNGDGNADIAAVLGGSTDSLRVILGNGNMAFPIHKGFRGHQWGNPRAITAVDFNNDGKPDVATANLIYSNLPSNQYDLYTWINQTPYFTVSGAFDICAPVPQTVTLNATSATALTYAWTANGNQATNGDAFNMAVTAANNILTVTGNNGFGCTNTSYKTVKVHPLPVVTLNAPQSVCIGESVTLTVTGNATHYDWEPSTINPGQAFTPDTTALYTVKGYSEFNCESSDTVTIFVHALPTVQTAINGHTMTATFTPTNAAIQWIDCGNNNAAIAGATQSTFTPSQNGDYAARVSAQGCEVISSCRGVTVPNGNASIEETGIKELSLYPNPNNGTFVIEFEKLLKDNSNISVVNLFGKVLETVSVTGENKHITMSLSLSSGIYFIRISDGKENYLKKLIIQ